MAAGYRSLLAFWAGGAASPPFVPPPPPTARPAVRSLLAFWMGGAEMGVPVASTGAQGYRSLLAYWAGGAQSPGFGPPPPPPPPPPKFVTPTGGGGALDPRWTSLTKAKYFPGIREMIEKDDQLILDVILMAITKDILH